MLFPFGQNKGSVARLKRKLHMKLKPKYAVGLGAAALLSAFCLGAVAANTWKLTINGHSVSTSARQIGGQTFVPINDVARALNMKATVKGTDIVLTAAGGAQQAGKLAGNTGEDLTSGLYGFKVVSTTRTLKYDLKYPSQYQSADTLEATAGQELVIVNCRLKNTTPTKQEFAFSTGEWAYNTSLTDLDEQSYQPMKFDVLADEGAPLGRYVLPGASLNFAIVFAVPKDTKLKDVVFSVLKYGDRGTKKFTDFRVSVKGN